MTFFNATLIFGVAAIAVPIALHLLARREPRQVDFPSIQFLTKKFESNRNRLRVRKWWLLALRIAALAALAIALARPAIHRSLSVTWLTIGLLAAVGAGLLVMSSVSMAKGGSKSSGYGLAIASLFAIIGAVLWGIYTTASGPAMSIDRAQPVAIAIVLDNSPSSAWNGNDDNRIERIKELAAWMVTRLPRTSRVAVIDRSAQTATFSLDSSSALTRIEQIRPLEVVQSITSRLEAAVRLVRTSDLTQRRVLVISDLTIATWKSAVENGGLAKTIADDPQVVVTLFDLGPMDGINRSLSIPEFAERSPPRGVPISVSATVAIDGWNQDSPLSVTADLEMFETDPARPVVRDGEVLLPEVRSVDRTSVKLSDEGDQEVVLTIPSLEVGTHHGRIRLMGDDVMPFDNVRYFSLQVLPPSRVLLVGDDREESRIISDAIAPVLGTTEEIDSPYAVEQVGYQDLPLVPLEDFDAVVLLDPNRAVITDSAVTRYAKSGGGVLICLGPAAGNEALESVILPRLVRRWRSADPGTFFQVINASHPVSTLLSTDTPWSDFPVRQYWQLEPDDRDSVLIEYAGTTHAALVERIFEAPQNQTAGHVLVVTTPLPAAAAPTRDWNDLFGIDAWPAWLLVRKSIEHVTGRGSVDRNTLVGQPTLIPLNTGQASTGTDPLPNRLQLFRPGGGLPVPLELPNDTNQIAVTEVGGSGTYWIRGLDPGNGFSANLPADALQTDRIETAQLDLVFGPDQYAVATSRDAIEFSESGAATSISLHSPAILLALACFLFEQILSNRFYRPKQGLVAH